MVTVFSSYLTSLFPTTSQTLLEKQMNIQGTRKALLFHLKAQPSALMTIKLYRFACRRSHNLSATFTASQHRNAHKVWVNDEQNILICWGGNWKLQFSKTAENKQLPTMPLNALKTDELNKIFWSTVCMESFRWKPVPDYREISRNIWIW